MEKKYYKIHKILNNNAIISMEKDEEFIVTGNGIGWQHRNGDYIEKKDFHKVYQLQNASIKNQFELLLNEIPFDCIQLTQSIIEKAYKELGHEFNQSLIITLADHIHFSAERYKSGIYGYGMVNEEIRRFYPDEYKVALDALDMINEHYKISLQKDEATVIAFHLVNAEYNISSDNTRKIVESIEHILNIIKDTLHIELCEDSLDYSRLVIHLKFFMKRIFALEERDDTVFEKILFNVDDSIGKDIELCLEQIRDYLQETYNYTLQENEKFYLLIHIIRVT